MNNDPYHSVLLIGLIFLILTLYGIRKNKVLNLTWFGKGEGGSFGTWFYSKDHPKYMLAIACNLSISIVFTILGLLLEFNVITFR